MSSPNARAHVIGRKLVGDTQNGVEVKLPCKFLAGEGILEDPGFLLPHFLEEFLWCPAESHQTPSIAKAPGEGNTSCGAHRSSSIASKS